jgi:hypothetical protein
MRGRGEGRRRVERLVFFLQVSSDLPFQFINTKERIFPKQVAAILSAHNGFGTNGWLHRFRFYSSIISSFNFLFHIFSLTPQVKEIIRSFNVYREKKSLRNHTRLPMKMILSQRRQLNWKRLTT